MVMMTSYLLRFLLITVSFDVALKWRLVFHSQTAVFTGISRCDAFVVRRNLVQPSNPLPVGRQRHICPTGSLGPLHSAATHTSFESMLLNKLTNNDTSLITVEGYLLSKRSLGKGLIFADFKVDNDDDDNNNNNDVCQGMLRREYYSKHGDDAFAVTRKQLLMGTKFQITGSAAPTRNPGNVVLLIHSVDFVGFPRQLQYIQMLLQQGQEGLLSLDQLLSAAGSPLPGSTLHSKLVQLLPSSGASNSNDDDDRPVVLDKHFLKQLARDILQALPDDPNYPEAANQVEFSKKGNFIVATAPPEWQQVPSSLLRQVTTPSSVYPRRDDRAGEEERVLSVVEALQRDDTKNDDLSASISVMGWVQNKRRFDGNITMMALVDDYASLLLQDSSEVKQGGGAVQWQTAAAAVADGPHQHCRLLALVHPDLVSAQVAGAYRNVVTVGAKVELHGRLLVKDAALPPSGSDDDTDNDDGGGSSTQNRIFWVDSIRLEQSSSRSVTIRQLLDLLQDGELERSEVVDALLISSTEEADSLLTMDPTQRQWKANELAIRLQEAAAASTNGGSKESTRSSRELLVDPSLLQALEQYKYLTERYPINATTLEEMEELLSLPVTSSETTVTRQQPANVVTRAPLPLGMPGSKWQHKKRPQLAWMGQQIREVLESHPEYGKRRLKILDIGGGKGSLANYLGQSMQEHVQVHVVDICEGAVANGASKAERLNLPVDFSLADASQALNVTADVVVALHACGHLSDVALAHALQRDAGFVIVPCCFNSNPQLQIPTQKDERKEQVSVSKWLGLPSDDWSALKLLAEVQGDITLANEAIGVLCAVRAQAACDYTSTERVCIKRFPIEFSTRNTVLVGRCRR